jgi:ubiquinone/menaquinone biosynthesis C-methylase UbiE
MPDVYATIENAGREVQDRLADVLELRAADAQQRAMTETYIGDLELAAGARVLEIGCGTGAVARILARRPEVEEVVGVDPSPVFVGRARELSQETSNLAFELGDGRELGFGDCSFDAVVLHTVLCHVPGPERVLEEARRVVRDGGRLGLFDGDYATTTVALDARDPLQACAQATIEALVHDPWLARRLRRLVSDAGWQVGAMRSHGYLETEEPGYTLTLVDRGADALVAAGGLGQSVADALKQEARRRARADQFFGHIAYVSLIATALAP